MSSADVPTFKREKSVDKLRRYFEPRVLITSRPACKTSSRTTVIVRPIPRIAIVKPDKSEKWHRMLTLYVGQQSKVKDLETKVSRIIKSSDSDIICLQAVLNVDQLLKETGGESFHVIKSIEEKGNNCEAVLLIRKEAFGVLATHAPAVRLVSAELQEIGDEEKCIVVGSWHGRKFIKKSKQMMSLVERKKHLAAMRQKIEGIALEKPWIIGGNFNIPQKKSGQTLNDIKGSQLVNDKYFLFDQSKLESEDVCEVASEANTELYPILTKFMLG